MAAKPTPAQTAAKDQADAGAKDVATATAQIDGHIRDALAKPSPDLGYLAAMAQTIAPKCSKHDGCVRGEKHAGQHLVGGDKPKLVNA